MLGSKTHNLKSARLVARRRKILIGKLILSVVCVCFLWWLLFYVSHLKSLVIDSIDVVGNNILDTEEIKNIAETSLNGDYFFTVPKASILFYPRSEIKKNISGNYPIIRDMSVGIKSLHEISISIVERKTEYLLCENSSEQNENISEDCYSVDDKGFSFANYSEVSTTTSQFVRFYPAGKAENLVGVNYFSIELFAKLSGFVHSLASEGLNINSVYEKNSNDFEGHFEKGQRIIFSRDTDLSGAFENLKTILESKEFGGIKTFEQIDYIDLRFGNKIFYKSK